MKVRITNIQRFCLSDGPGIRTTVFLKGCNLKCPWCANPENIDYNFNKYIDKNGEIKVFGYDIELNDLFNELMKDKNFYRLNNGGITFSGGEPLLQIKKIEPLLKKIKDEKINICFETSLNVPQELVKIAIDYADEFIVDIKILDRSLALNILKFDLDLYYNNINLVLNNSIIESFRIPVSQEYTFNNNNIDELIKFLKKYKSRNVEIFKIHNLAKNKYELLNLKMNSFSDFDNKRLLELKLLLEKLNCNVRINTL